MRRIWRENGLSIALLGLFLAIFIFGYSTTGHREYNSEQEEHGVPPISYFEYLTTSHFLETASENWESEFLEMFAYVLLTSFLFQKGSAESKKLDESNPVDRDPRKSRKKNVPSPVRKGGLTLKLYENSLAIAFLLLFLLSFSIHAISGTGKYNEEQLQHGELTVSVPQYVSTSRFWFESFQNWQSEFLGVGSVVILSIFLRQRGSPESKPVDSLHSQTGNE